MGINQDGNGNDPYSHGNWFPSTAVVNCYRIWQYSAYTEIMVALWFLLSSVFPRLISAVGDWMSAIIPHMVWP